MAAVRYIGFVVTSSYCIQVVYVKFLTLCEIFISFGLVLSNIFGLLGLCFIILAGNLLLGAKCLGVYGAYTAQISIFKFITPKSHNLA